MLDFNYCWELFINLYENFLFVIFMDDKMTLSSKLNSKLSIILKTFFVLLNSFQITTLNSMHMRFEYSYLINFVCILLFTYLLYKENISIKLLFSSEFLGMLFASDILSCVLMHSFTKANITDIIAGMPLRIPATLIHITSLAVLVFLSHFIKWRYISMSPIESGTYIAICITGCFFVQYIIDLAIDSYDLNKHINLGNKLIHISNIFCILFLILLIYIYALNYTKALNQTLIDERHQLLLEEREYKNLITATKSLQILKHDMQHHLSTIQYLIEAKKYTELDDYIINYSGTMNHMQNCVFTGIPPIDCILSTCIPRAQSYGIHVNSLVIIPSAFKLNPVHTTTLLGNLWSNAITACKKVIGDVSTKATIDFSIRPFQNMVLIHIKNTYNGILKKDNKGNYLSTKESGLRGLGIKRIKEIVEQNDGIINITDNNHLFCVYIMFPLGV